LRQAGVEFGNRLELILPEDWGRATPCEAWNVRQLVNHVVGGNVRYTMILEGREASAVLATHDLDGLGSDPVGAFRSSLERVTQAFEAPGALAARVHHPKSGQMSGAQLRVLRVNELTVHAWDLAHAIGADPDLDDDLAQWLFDRLSPLQATLARSGLYGPPGPSRQEPQRAQVRLLQLLGRRP